MIRDEFGVSRSAHIHGGVHEHLFSRYGQMTSRLLDFSVSVSPLGPPQLIQQRWNTLLGHIHLYPTPDGNGVCDYFCGKYGLNAGNVLAGNGSVELMYRCFSALPIRKMAVIYPSFFDYENALRVAEIEIEPVYLKGSNAFQSPDADALEDALTRNDGLLLGNPNNPTGTRYDSEMLLDLAQRFPQKLFCVDEAFLPFFDDELKHTMLRPERLRENIIVFHSLTKIYAIPGIRIGAAISDSKTIAALSRFSPPWMVSVPAEHIARILLECSDYVLEVRKLVAAEMHRMKVAIDRMSRLEWVSEAANFALIQLKEQPPFETLQEYLFKKGIVVRDCRNFKGLHETYFRICTRTPDDNDVLLNALHQICND